MVEYIKGFLNLPADTLCEIRVPKTYFKKTLALSAAEKKLLDTPDALQSILWLAGLKPATCNVPVLETEAQIYEEVQVFLVYTGSEFISTKAAPITDLVQKYIQYPVLLLLYSDTHFITGVREKYRNRNDAEKLTQGATMYTHPVAFSTSDTNELAFLQSLAFARTDKTNLQTLYQSYAAAITALKTAGLTGSFNNINPEQALVNTELLKRIEQLQAEVTAFSKAAHSEYHIAERVRLNIRIQDCRKNISELTSMLN